MGLFDELVWGVLEAALPLIRNDLDLSYSQVGLLLAVPTIVSGLVEPSFGVLAERGWTRRLTLAGGAAFAGSLLLAAWAPAFLALFLAYVVLYPASGAFVMLTEAGLMDREPAARERNMARWVVAGSVGVVLGPLLVAGAVVVDVGWRSLLVGLAVVGGLLVRAVPRPLPSAAPRPAVRFLSAVRATLGRLRDREVLRWLVLLEVQDLMVDVLFGFLALYLVDVAGADPAAAGVGVAVWTAAGLAGDALLLRILRRVSGVAWLRASALATGAVFPAFLLVPSLPAKVALLAVLAILTSGWYVVPKARLYGELPDASGTVLSLSALTGLAGGVLPLMLGALAQAAGLGFALWLCMLGPAGVLLLLAGQPSGRVEDGTVAS